MRLGFRVTLVVMDERINNENLLILQLWSTYVQYFSQDHVKSVKKKRKDTKERREQNPQNQPRSEAKALRLRNSALKSQDRLKDYIQKEVLWRKFLLVWNDCYNTNHLPLKEWRSSDACIRMSCYYSYACFWVCNQKLLGEESARDVLGYTESSVSQNPVWSIKAMAFGIAVKIIATSYHDRGEFCEGELVLENAIEKLSRGDEGCLNRAIGLCLTLGSWRHKRKDHAGYQDTEQQLLAIQSRIPGMKRNEYSPSSPEREIDRTDRSEGASRSNRWVQDKRSIVIESNGVLLESNRIEQPQEKMV
ncbi:hypothetical protein TruAng_008387 [Truncatella angustata]|nr:hypothetical protein TruAng_008387 [Truncatella angustata]